MITGSLKLSNLLPLLNKIVLAIIPEINTLLNRDKKIFMTMLCPLRETALFIIRYCVCGLDLKYFEREVSKNQVVPVIFWIPFGEDLPLSRE